MKTVVLFFIILSILACKHEKIEFKDLDENFKYKLLSFDEHEKPYQQNDFVRASIKLIEGTDTIFNKLEFIPFQPKNLPFYNLISDLN